MTRTAKLSFYFILFIIFGLIGLWMPLLGDDLHWGTYFGSNYFPQGIFLKYDGRYLGDLLVITMTKVRPIAFLAYGTFMTTIVYLIQKIREQIKMPKSIGLVSASLATALILLTPKVIFKQILGWHAGFANYVPSLVFPLFMLYLVLKNYDNKDVHYYRTSTILIFFAAIAAQFFAEHITILNVFNSILVWLFLRKHFGNHFKKILNLILIGNFIGAFLMFINGAYLKILFGTDSYRSVKGSATADTMFNYMRTQFSMKHLLLLGVATLIFTVAVILYTLRIKNTKQKIANFSLLLSGFVVIAPFLVVSPFGSRCMFATYMFFIAIFAINFDLLLTAYERYILPIFMLIAIGLGIKTDAVAHNYGKTFNMQIQYSQYQNTVNRNTQYFLQYKDTNYIWLTAPIQDDGNFAELYVKDANRNKVPINYYDWTDAANKIKKNKYQTHDEYMKAFDKQILQKVKLIQAKENK
ncbi:hypothetical protein [Companilactobacillus kimchiensis]|uniref:Teichoic acid polysaccharide export protein n=1 Tax=Companilactobacillus kimchiensis TaxID=993692 RepID=A0A0R2LEN8_9LACO|nr:hypothetical protein [Companilactobacillus kimchiensis]KRO00440.1 teichoic acid polysaccharide export protein [Companilactobacillus kimchiensis]